MNMLPIQPQTDMDQASFVWNSVLARLRAEMDIAPIAWQTWFSQSTAIAVIENRLLVQVPQEYVRNNLQERWMPTLEALMQDIAPHLTLSFILENEKPQFTRTDRRDMHSGLVNQFSFDNFIVGDSNRLAYAAARAVAEQPAHVYNPLFLYGGTGLGKTHLMHAIGNEALARNPTLRVLYVSSERFTNDLIAAIRNGTTSDFRAQYRHVDILLIDDIQLIAGRESTQGEIFHTFNELYNYNKQIILSSDRPPREIQHLEERLRSRFETGLQADIEPPDLDTRVAILSTKAREEGIEATPEALVYMAEMARANVRELEGTFNRVCAYARLTGRIVDQSMAREALRSLTPVRADTKIDPAAILDAVADAQGVTLSVLQSPQRSARVALARQMAMYLLREMTSLSLPRIGDLLGGRDHTTVLHGIDKIERLMSTHANIRQEVQALRARILEQA